MSNPTSIEHFISATGYFKAVHRNQERQTKAKKSYWCDAVNLTSRNSTARRYPIVAKDLDKE